MGGKSELRWTEQQGKIAKDLCAKGKTAAEIGVVVKKTRNAVIGYLNRNGIRMSDVTGKFAPPVPRKPPVRVERKAGVIHNKLKPIVKKPPILKFDPVRTKDGIMGIPFLKSGPNQCRYIIEERPAIICGEPTKSMSCSWCEEHYNVVYVKAEPRSQGKNNRQAQSGLGRNRSPSMAQRSS